MLLFIIQGRGSRIHKWKKLWQLEPWRGWWLRCLRLHKSKPSPLGITYALLIPLTFPLSPHEEYYKESNNFNLNLVLGSKFWKPFFFCNLHLRLKVNSWIFSKFQRPIWSFKENISFFLHKFQSLTILKWLILPNVKIRLFYGALKSIWPRWKMFSVQF